MSKKKKKSYLKEAKSSAKAALSDSGGKEKLAVKEGEIQNLTRKIQKAIDGLWYMSETDAEILVFTGSKTESTTQDVLIKQADVSADKEITEKNFNEFFAHLTAIQDWFGEEETRTAQRFSDLKDLLEKNLRELKVFKIGRTEVDIYVVGLDSQDILTGIKTKAVET